MIRPFLCFLILNFTSGLTRAEEPIEFNRDIRPILSENCFLCHGPDKSHRKAGLRLDDRASALKKEAIVPGDPDASEIIGRIFNDDVDQIMPPPESNKTLTATQKQLLKRWVAEGAGYQAHWAYEPIRRPAIPTVRDQSWIRNPVDAFILHGLESRGWKPSAEADRRTLIRRLSLDLIGLPPTPSEVKTFESDPSPDAYEKLVDRLLASPHYGERMAVPWLDLARFADTVGYHGDQNQHIFPYRDYVVDAFNKNLPFDRFTLEQLAGDLLPDPTPEQLVATGFNRLNMMTREGGAQPREYLAKYAGDRVRTVSITWLGSTMGCAECHDHKFDPFAARDFYRMAAFFADIQQWGVYMDYTYTPNPDLRGFSNDHPFPPEIEVASPFLQRRLARIDSRLSEATADASRRLGADPSKQSLFGDWLKSAIRAVESADRGWVVGSPSLVSSPGDDRTSTRLDEDRSLLLTGKGKPKETTSIRLDGVEGWVASIRLELLPRSEHGDKIVRSGGPPTISLSIQHPSKPDAIEIFQADSSTKVDRYVNGSALLGINGGWKVPANSLGSRLSAVYQLKTPIRMVGGDSLVVKLKGDNLGCVRLSTSPLVFDDLQAPRLSESLVKALQEDPQSRTAGSSLVLQEAFLRASGADPAFLAEYQRLTLDRLECRGGMAWTMITRHREPLPTRILPRGNWQDESGELLTPGVPRFLPQPAEADSRRLDRVDLARWLTSAENPLTARVFANRLWKQFFGNGLSAVMEDVGAQGEWPSHPELLDWLASEFRDGWNVKALVKQMVMSATYRQSSKLRPELREADPMNRWLASQNPRRLEAEFVRDNALSIAGLLNPEIGGPSVKPYQPAGYYAILQFPDRDYVADRDEQQYRRGLYSHWQRTFLQPMLANFDAPGREECIAARVVANTPQQALTLLNDPTFVESARVLAGSILEGPEKSDGDRIDRIFERALSRPAGRAEKDSLLAFLARQRSETAEHREEASRLLKVGLAPNPLSVESAELAAWTEVCRVVLNLHESIMRY